MPSKKEKIVILGGGVSAMTSAFYLTESENWQDKYDITLYQLGWRLGGKGASGRNAEFGERIEEHGLHIWFGFYANAFKTIQSAYQAWERPTGSPLSTWQDAFKPHNLVVLEEFIQNNWESWSIEFPYIPGNPANGDENLDLWDLLKTAYFWLRDSLVKTAEKGNEIKKLQPITIQDSLTQSWLATIADEVEGDAEQWLQQFEGDFTQVFDHLTQFIESMPTKAKKQSRNQHQILQFLLKQIRYWLTKEFVHLLETHTELRRLFIIADLGLTIFIGFLEDGVFAHGFDVINQYDYKQWLLKHGANKAFTVDSAPVRGFYDLVFAYVNGDFSQPNVEAGTILRAMLRMAFLYKGGVMWKMQAGMGDTIFSPMYQVLQKRGVKFEFFHQVDELIPLNNSIEQIRLTQQVKLADGITNYHPLVNVKDLPCWPSKPNYAQIDAEQAKLLQDNQINLESFWSDWPQVYQAKFNQPLPVKTLQKGVDFDVIIFGISVASIEHLCPQLLAQDAALKTMTEKVQTVVTQAYQIWTNQTLTELGWPLGAGEQEPVLSGFTEPFDTWAAMNQLLIRENNWAPNVKAKNVAYFCSAQPVNEFPPRSEVNFPSMMAAKVKQNAINQLNNDIYWLWPNAASKGTFDWQVLLNTDVNSQGESRFEQQFWRSNIDPSERYVLSVRDSSRYRLTTNGSRFNNLYLTGDWIKTGLNAGCVEAATMAGMQTSRAICGTPEIIVGESDFAE